MTKHKWNALSRHQTKKKSSSLICLLLLFFCFFGVAFASVQCRLFSQNKIGFLKLSAVTRPYQLNKQSETLNEKTTSIYISEKFVAIANLKNMLSLNDKKDFLVFPRTHFLENHKQILELKSQFPNASKHMAVLIDPKTSSRLANWTEIQSIQSKINTVFHQEHTFLLVAGGVN